MKRWLILSLTILGIMALDAPAADAEEIVETLKKAALPGNGIQHEEDKAAEKVQAAGAAVIPPLLLLLRDDDEDVRDLAAYTLGGMPGLTEEHLDALMESCRRSTSWLPPAIARIGTPRAVTFLVEELVRVRETSNQLTRAMEILGEKAVPDLLRKVYQEDPQWDSKLEQTMEQVFHVMGASSAAAIDPLLKIATDEALPLEKRTRAIAAVGAMGQPAVNAAATLRTLRAAGDEEIRNAATSALLSVSAEDAAPILAKTLQESTDWSQKLHVLRSIATLKLHGRAAGPVVTKHLSDDIWTLREGAARTLGYIGYEAAVDDLVKLLAQVENWRLAFNAAESLGRLKSQQALPALAQTAKDYWFPPVRAAAEAAIRAIRDGIVVESRYHEDNFALEYFAYEDAGRDMETLEKEDEKLIRFPMAAAQAQPVTVTAKDEDGTVRRVEMQGLKVEGGHLVGYDEGEFGGGILFVAPNGDPLVVADNNTETILRVADDIVAVTGLAHGSNHGSLLKIIKNTDGGWTTTKWRALPGAPKFSRLLKDGRLLIICHGGIVLVSPDGKMTSLTRDEALAPAAPPR